MPLTLSEHATQLRLGTFQLARRLRAEKADDELSDGQFSVLAALYVHGPHTLGALAEREHVSPPSMNRTVNCLEKNEYLSRLEDPADRRRVTIALTEAGTALVRDTVTQRDAWISKQLLTLTPEERDTIARAAEIMRRLATQ
ncbi:MarR family winged helix-turn-helix transcriptional regulator [Mycetocola spongiae]|uniref:MarR family winged helix-turn-helix transcriptional regulator n=1 Tax=Mycetocola spongiae TaxID=2859226 RepID=UPI001CF1A4BA|nr:MarR family transcriptional regulator [Mycetocola spongiae]UCR88141.1 MarR family transcriptional regulator [Mycetocola spongiae]